MTDKALISDLTWRSLEMQQAAFPDMAHYIAPHDIANLLRQTTRKEPIVIHVLSLGVVADNLNSFVEFMEALPRQATVISKEDNCTIGRGGMRKAVTLWRAARKHGAQKIGGKISAEKREAESKIACNLIRDRWPLPSKIWRTPVLLKEAGIAYNTAVKNLGPRPIAQYNYRAKMKRKQRQEDAK